MKKPVVRLKIRVRMPDGSYPFLDPVFVGNNKLKPGYALVNGKAEHHPEGIYYIRYRKNAKQEYEPVGSDAQLASIEKIKRERHVEAKAAGVPVVEDTAQTQTPLPDSIAEYLAETKALKAHKTYLAYHRSLDLFAKSKPKPFLEQLGRKDVLNYMTYMRSEEGLGNRTVANHVNNLRTFFLHFKLAWPLEKKDKPKFTEKLVSAYTHEDIERLMAAANREERDMFIFFLATGAREQEVQFATWRDINWATKMFEIREKLDLGFTPKDSEEGDIPVPDSLIEMLKARRKRVSGRLIFPTAAGKPNGHLLRTLKKVALRAGMNCGYCRRTTKEGRELCCAEQPICDYLELHKFRKTFASWHHEQGVPVRTIQKWLRHSDLETTLRYLAGSDDTTPKTRERVNSTFASIAAA